MKEKLKVHKKVPSINEEHTFWIIVAKRKTYGHVIQETLSNTKKEAIKKLIPLLCDQAGQPHSHRWMKQTIQETWKEMREDKSYSAQQITFTTLFNI